MKKRPLVLILLLLILSVGLFFVATVSPAHQDSGLEEHVECSLGHSFVLVGLDISLVFGLDQVGPFRLKGSPFSPQQYVLLPFKPPRLSS